MNYTTLRFGASGESIDIVVGAGYDQFANKDVMVDMQRFINHVPNLKPEEPFYFGFWRVVVRLYGERYRLWEWDFETDDFNPMVAKSLVLWHEQSGVCLSQNLSWTSVGLDEDLLATPSVFRAPMGSTTEGVRDKGNLPDSSGWLLYTAHDRESNLNFERVPLHQALRIFNVNILRFLGLPDGWMFNVEVNGASHIWKEEES